jgi:hypothetical protein
MAVKLLQKTSRGGFPHGDNAAVSRRQEAAIRADGDAFFPFPAGTRTARGHFAETHVTLAADGNEEATVGRQGQTLNYVLRNG